MTHALDTYNQTKDGGFLGIPSWLWFVALGGVLLWWSASTQTAHRRAVDPKIPSFRG